MPAANTFHTLNDYRLAPEPIYEERSSSKLGAGALVVAIFLGVGAYSYYSTHQRSSDTVPVSYDANYQAPAVSESPAPADTMYSAPTPDASGAAALAPTAPSTDAMRASAQESTMGRTAPESKSNVSPAQTAQPPKQSTKPLIDPNSRAAPPTTGDTAATAPMTPTAPIAPQAPTADSATDTEESTAAPPATSAEAVPDTAVEENSGDI